MRIFIIIRTLFLLSHLVHAQKRIQLWEDGDMPFAKESNLKEETKEAWGTSCVFNVVQPELYIYEAVGENSKKAVLILPGGGYEMEAIVHEGHDVAKRLAEKGITAAVLKYRLPLKEISNTPELLPITDTQRALELMRSYSQELGFEANKVGILGFSAGGHLAAYACSKDKQKPNFSLIIYGCPRLTEENVEWLEKSLFHRSMTESELADLNILEKINTNTPTSFLVHALDDEVCDYEETKVYAEKLLAHQVPFELHTFPTGGHGFGLGDEKNGTIEWINLAINWIKRQ